MSEVPTWEWPPGYAESIKRLYEIVIPNPEPNRTIRIEDLGGLPDELQP